jgi:hypothetical protein
MFNITLTPFAQLRNVFAVLSIITHRFTSDEFKCAYFKDITPGPGNTNNSITICIIIGLVTFSITNFGLVHFKIICRALKLNGYLV